MSQEDKKLKDLNISKIQRRMWKYLFFVVIPAIVIFVVVIIVVLVIPFTTP